MQWKSHNMKAKQPRKAKFGERKCLNCGEVIPKTDITYRHGGYREVSMRGRVLCNKCNSTLFYK